MEFVKNLYEILKKMICRFTFFIKQNKENITNNVQMASSSSVPPPIDLKVLSETTTNTTETIAEKMRKIALDAREKRSENGNDEAWKDEKNNKDIKLFFETEIKVGAVGKIEKRAVIGANNANILEYKFDEYFYVKDGKVIRTQGFDRKPGIYLHKIYKVMQTKYFQDLLQEFINELGEMCFACWAPAKNLNVIEVYWGPTKNHEWKEDETDDDIASHLPDTLDTPKGDSKEPSPAAPAAPSAPAEDDKSYKTVAKRGGKKVSSTAEKK
uniref:Uncharacterized protein n=1 Tax=viral metagenome TaxID=1070528 RepID=A0A6C0KWW8_9ZZZZ